MQQSTALSLKNQTRNRYIASISAIVIFLFSFATANATAATTDAAPAVIGAISAVSKNGQLSVTWVTETEANCKEYTIEASKDWEKWVPIGKVSAKSVNGKSSQPINYDFNLKLAGLKISGLSAILFLMMSFFKNRWARIAVLAGTVVFFASCDKGDTLKTLKPNGSLTVRISQQDMNGNNWHSKPIRVIVE